MSRTGRALLITLAAVLLGIAAFAVCGWAFDDANPAALGLGAGAAWVLSQLP